MASMCLIQNYNKQIKVYEEVLQSPGSGVVVRDCEASSILPDKGKGFETASQICQSTNSYSAGITDKDLIWDTY